MGGDAAGAWPDGATILVLSGGASRRLGRDKATTHVGGRRLIDRLLAAVPADVPVVLAGPPLADLPGRVIPVREDPPGSGPLAGIGAGAGVIGTPLVGIIAADMPFAVPVLRESLCRLAAHGDAAAGDPASSPGPADAHAVLARDDAGHVQPLCGAYRTDALRTALGTLGPLAGRPVRALLPLLRVMEWPVPAPALADVDTVEQLAAARRRATEEGTQMQEWVNAVREALGLEVAVDLDTILDVARDAAHNVVRPAAPLTTYLLGAAVAQGADPAEAAATVSRLAAAWSDRPE